MGTKRVFNFRHSTIIFVMLSSTKGNVGRNFTYHITIVWYRYDSQLTILTVQCFYNVHVTAHKRVKVNPSKCYPILITPLETCITPQNF